MHDGNSKILATLVHCTLCGQAENTIDSYSQTQQY